MINKVTSDCVTRHHLTFNSLGLAKPKLSPFLDFSSFPVTAELDVYFKRNIIPGFRPRSYLTQPTVTFFVSKNTFKRFVEASFKGLSSSQASRQDIVF